MEAVIEYFNRIATYDPSRVVIELFFIGLAVYWFVDFLEGTRGERLFHGVVFIIIAGVLVLKLIVHRFEFERLEYLYSRFLIVILIITVAAFQPEIRRALIRIGRPRFLGGSPHELTRTIEEIINAAIDLSSSRTGAIIVIEQQVGLKEFIEAGVRVDAKVTAELLRTIFQPRTALHDMAVIIQADRIVAARVQLPLAESGTVEGVELGSRHRAALGITASSDALVIVVSEETGIISIAQGGRLTRNIAETQMRKHLAAAFRQTPNLAERFWKAQPTKTAKQIKK